MQEFKYSDNRNKYGICQHAGSDFTLFLDFGKENLGWYLKIGKVNTKERYDILKPISHMRKSSKVRNYIFVS